MLPEIIVGRNGGLNVKPPFATHEWSGIMFELFLDEQRFSILVDHAVPLARMISAGNFRFVTPLITTIKCPTRPGTIREVAIRLAYLHPQVIGRTVDVVQWLSDNNMRPAMLEEVLALSVACCNRRMPKKLQALGSPFIDPQLGRTSYVAASLASPRNRRLTLSSLGVDHGWAAIWDCFPCVVVS